MDNKKVAGLLTDIGVSVSKWHTDILSVNMLIILIIKYILSIYKSKRRILYAGTSERVGK